MISNLDERKHDINAFIHLFFPWFTVPSREKLISVLLHQSPNCAFSEANLELILPAFLLFFFFFILNYKLEMNNLKYILFYWWL